MVKAQSDPRRQSVITTYSPSVLDTPRTPIAVSQAATGKPAFWAESLKSFWSFVCERQSIWHKRVVEKRPPPWTDDPILRENRFTNVYRECDPGTDFLIQHILETKHDDKDKIFNVMLYRLIGRKETYERIGFQNVQTFNTENFANVLKDIRLRKESPFSGAYTVCSYSQLGSSDKVENVAQVFGTLRDTFSSLFERITRSPSAQNAYEELRTAYGFGKFLAYQVLVDLLYPLKCKHGVPILPFHHDDWAIAGPGASRGIQILLRESNRASELAVMQWLRQNQRLEFHRLGLSFNYRNDERGEPILLTLANIQNCLCEFYKYSKIKAGTGRARRKFSPRSYFQEQLNVLTVDSGS